MRVAVEGLIGAGSGRRRKQGKGGSQVGCGWREGRAGGGCLWATFLAGPWQPAPGSMQARAPALWCGARRAQGLSSRLSSSRHRFTGSKVQTSRFQCGSKASRPFVASRLAGSCTNCPFIHFTCSPGGLGLRVWRTILADPWPLAPSLQFRAALTVGHHVVRATRSMD